MPTNDAVRGRSVGERPADACGVEILKPVEHAEHVPAVRDVVRKKLVRGVEHADGDTRGCGGVATLTPPRCGETGADEELGLGVEGVERAVDEGRDVDFEVGAAWESLNVGEEVGVNDPGGELGDELCGSGGDNGRGCDVSGNEEAVGRTPKLRCVGVGVGGGEGGQPGGGAPSGFGGGSGIWGDVSSRRETGAVEAGEGPVEIDADAVLA